MISSIWRLAHFVLAAVSSFVLIIASVTGIILACNTVGQKLSYSNQTRDLKKITLAESLPCLQKQYPEITDISVDKNNLVILSGLDQQNNSVKAIVDPISGKILGKPPVDSNFIQQVRSLHRSLFMHETGRFIVGIVAFLLLLISLTGLILFVKRQQGIRHFFTKTPESSFVQYIHVLVGKWLLLPLLIISITGTFLFMKRFGFIPEKQADKKVYSNNRIEKPQKNLADFEIFKQTHLSDITKLEFPFMEDPDEFYVLKLKDKELKINQYDGSIVSETNYPFQLILENISLDWHTGRANIIWAVILGIASLSIIAFIWSGFTITIRRFSGKRKNEFTATNAKIILLVGSENGTTRKFAADVQKQLLQSGQKAFMADLNEYTLYPKAKYLIVLTSTYGKGIAPSCASLFVKRFENYQQDHSILFSVVGFGSKSFTNSYCQFAVDVDEMLSQEKHFCRLLDLHKINKRSAEEFATWAKQWSIESGIPL